MQSPDIAATFLINGRLQRLEILLAAPRAVDTLSDRTFVQGTAIAPLDVSQGFSGPVSAYDLGAGSDPLPAGLALNGTTGVITGIPAAPVLAAQIVIRAVNAGGYAETRFAIAVTAVAAPALSGLTTTTFPAHAQIGQESGIGATINGTAFDSHAWGRAPGGTEFGTGAHPTALAGADTNDAAAPAILWFRGGKAGQTHDLSAAIRAVPPVITGQPVLSTLSPVTGEAITATRAPVTGGGLDSGQWLLDGLVAIDGATALSYPVSSGALGHGLAYAQTRAGSGGSATATSVVSGPAVATTVPVVTGLHDNPTHGLSARGGDMLTGSDPRGQPDSHQWQARTGTAAARSITGATAATHSVAIGSGTLLDRDEIRYAATRGGVAGFSQWYVVRHPQPVSRNSIASRDYTTGKAIPALDVGATDFTGFGVGYSGTLPAGLSLDAATGRVTGTMSTVGSGFAATVTGTNSGGAAVSGFAISAVALAIVPDGANGYLFTAGRDSGPITITVNGTDVALDPALLTAGPFSAGNPVLSGAPTIGSVLTAVIPADILFDDDLGPVTFEGQFLVGGQPVGPVATTAIGQTPQHTIDPGDAGADICYRLTLTQGDPGTARSTTWTSNAVTVAAVVTGWALSPPGDGTLTPTAFPALPATPSIAAIGSGQVTLG